MLNAIPNTMLIGISPFEVPDCALVAGLCRAGAVGVLDLGRDERRARRALSTLAADVSTPFGVRIPQGSDACPTWLPPQASLVILPSVEAMDTWRSFTVVVQVTSVSEARSAVSAGVDGLIAKGSESGGRVGDEAAFILLQRLVAEEFSVPIWVQGGVGMHTAAACIAGGAKGVVVDSQLALVRKSSFGLDFVDGGSGAARRLPEQKAYVVKLGDLKNAKNYPGSRTTQSRARSRYYTITVVSS